MPETQIAADPVPEGKDMSGAPLQSALPDAANQPGQAAQAGQPGAAAKADAATSQLGLRSAAAPPDPEKAAPGKVVLTAPERRTVTVDDVTITEDGTEVDEAVAERAHEAAQLAGFQLKEV